MIRHYDNEKRVRKCVQRIVRAMEYKVLASWHEHVELMKHCRNLCKRVINADLHMRLERWHAFCGLQQQWRKDQLAKMVKKMLRAREQAAFNSMALYANRSKRLRKLKNKVNGHSFDVHFHAWKDYFFTRKNMTPADLLDEARKCLQCAVRVHQAVKLSGKRKAARNIQRVYRGRLGRVRVMKIRHDIQAELDAKDEVLQARLQWERDEERSRQRLELVRQHDLKHVQKKIAHLNKKVKKEGKRLDEEERVMLETGEKEVNDATTQLARAGLAKNPAKARMQKLKTQMQKAHTAEKEREREKQLRLDPASVDPKALKKKVPKMPASELNTKAKAQLLEDILVEALLMSMTQFRMRSPPLVPDSAEEGEMGIETRNRTITISREVALALGALKERTETKKSRMREMQEKLQGREGELQLAGVKFLEEQAAKDKEQADKEAKEEEEARLFSLHNL